MKNCPLPGKVKFHYFVCNISLFCSILGQKHSVHTPSVLLKLIIIRVSVCCFAKWLFSVILTEISFYPSHLTRVRLCLLLYHLDNMWSTGWTVNPIFMTFSSSASYCVFLRIKFYIQHFMLKYPRDTLMFLSYSARFLHRKSCT